MRETPDEDVKDIINEQVPQHSTALPRRDVLVQEITEACIHYINKREAHLQAEVRRLTQECNTLSAHVKGLEGAIAFKNWEISQAELKAARNVADYGHVCVEYRTIKERIASAINRGDLPRDFWTKLNNRPGGVLGGANSQAGQQMAAQTQANKG